MTDTTPTREKMIKAIYEKIADKTPSFGCVVGRKDGTQLRCIDKDEYCYIANDGKWDYYYVRSINDIGGEATKFDTIIGHPVMIGDVLDWIDVSRRNRRVPASVGREIEDRTNIIEKIYKIYEIWKEKRKPIDEQSDDCITFINSLLPDER